MMTNMFSNRLPNCFPSVLLKDSVSSIGTSVKSLPYRKYAILSKSMGASADDFSVPYLDDALHLVEDVGYVLTRRVVLVTESIYQAARVALCIKFVPKVREYKEKGYVYSTDEKKLPVDTPDFLPVFDFCEAQHYEKNCVDDVYMAHFSQCCDQIFVGMRGYCGSTNKMLSILNNAGGRIQFLVVSKEDLDSEWFDVLQRDDDMYIIHLEEPDDSYYVKIIQNLFKQTGRYELIGITPQKIVYLARKKYGLGKNRNLTEEDLAWFFDKAAINVMQKEHALLSHIELTEEDFAKLLPGN